MSAASFCGQPDRIRPSRSVVMVRETMPEKRRRGESPQPFVIRLPGWGPCIVFSVESRRAFKAMKNANAKWTN
ncbi:hypothetical protein RSSM_05785 [Rhodopirellula sallentina SM41]|uniref:Uncharacterized protein n=1 Tax=Rhodopirellula sallentina SM41 TaxID=1263870 RepID=M5TUD1_9BACT|nr:hypothetical protein RSSM_05785 [Rhodopirellula sallentina SM41]